MWSADLGDIGERAKLSKLIANAISSRSMFPITFHKNDNTNYTLVFVVCVAGIWRTFISRVRLLFNPFLEAEVVELAVAGEQKDEIESWTYPRQTIQIESVKFNCKTFKHIKVTHTVESSLRSSRVSRVFWSARAVPPRRCHSSHSRSTKPSNKSTITK